MKPIRILIAPNAFKHSLDAMAVALAIQEGLYQSPLACRCTCFPVGDGGDGTGGLLIGRRNGVVITAAVADPLGRPVSASFGLVNAGKTAIIELASASGIQLLTPDERDPMRADTFGTGQLIGRALDAGATEIILALGGSATVDGGTGLLRALGIRLLDASGRELTTPGSLTRLARIDGSARDARLSGCSFTVLCDVDNPLLGEAGSAAVFGPQKGATPTNVAALDAGLATLTTVARQQTGIDMATLRHGGAAGGAAAGLRAFLDATLVDGIDFFLDFTGFDDALADADLVITGEGSIDEQTIRGKGPYGVARRAKAYHLPVIGLAGSVPLRASTALDPYFDSLLAIGHGPADLAAAFIDTRPNLIRTARQLGHLLHLGRVH